MSGNSKKREDDEKAIFDGGRFGIGHNQGPALEDSETETPDIDNAPTKPGVCGPILSDAHNAQLKEWEKSRQLEKVKQVSAGSEALDARMAALAAGGVDGLVSKRGFRRIIPGATREEQEWIEEHAWKLREIAKDILHGRNATVFERRFLNPLDGHPKPPVGELAAQFNVTEKRIYNIEEDCKRRVIEEYRRRSAPKSHGDKCPMCGRVYAEWDFSQCRYTVDNQMQLSIAERRKHNKYTAPSWTVRWSRVKWPSRLNPDCLPYNYWLELVEMQRKFFGIF
jgi:hypothetical protein